MRPQTISIGGKCNRLGIVEHEVLHTLGFWHEQSRYDRDDYVIIVWENIADEQKVNFKKSPPNEITLNSLFDYISVMHYHKKAFSRNHKPTIITKVPEYLDLIGQRLEMTPTDVFKLNNLYNCGPSISFMVHCNFDVNVCGMTQCSKDLSGGWERMSSAVGGPSTDHTSLVYMGGYFMHASTASGVEGDSAWLETERMNLSRNCHVQCLQFYYYHSGNKSDELNIWIREHTRHFKGRMRLMGQIKGLPAFKWLLYHVPLDAKKPFQVVFEARKGGDHSLGGFSIDDINLSETECPHHTWEINDFEKLLADSNYVNLYSPPMYSAEGYAFQVIIILQKDSFGVVFRLVSGMYDERIAWPCSWRQVTIQLLDQNPHIQQQMSKQMTITTDPSDEAYGNPREIGAHMYYNGESLYVNPTTGLDSFFTLSNLRQRDYLKDGVVIFLITMQDISSLQQNSYLPCPKLQPLNFTRSDNHDKWPCTEQ